jgi:uncharacterized iron-regulated membrane protein
MTDLQLPSIETAPERPPKKSSSSGLFRAFWRWHFYASFLVVPVLLLLATTGLIYLFRFQLEPLLHADQMKLDQPVADAAPYDTQLKSVQEAHPDWTVLSMTEGGQLADTTTFTTETPSGEVRDVYVNPENAEVLGAINPDTTLSGYAVRLHGDLMAGKKGDALIELGACWAIVMAITGYYLFFRGRRARARRRSSGVAGAALRSRHGLIGSIAGIGLLFLLVSGLPWTGFWGERVQQLATDRGSSLWSLDPGAESAPASTLDESLPHSHDVPWGAGKSEVPQSDQTQSEGARGSVANLDTAVVVADGEGLRHPMTVSLPADEAGVFSVIGYAFGDPSRERTVHVDQYCGDVRSEYGFDDYPLLAKVVSQGIGLHEGRSLGLVSFWGAALMATLVIASCVTGPLMWWRRRPKGRTTLGAPQGRLPLRTSPPLAIGLVVLAVFLPLFGASLIAVLLLDQLLLRRVPALAGWFGSA